MPGGVKKDRVKMTENTTYLAAKVGEKKAKIAYCLFNDKKKKKRLRNLSKRLPLLNKQTITFSFFFPPISLNMCSEDPFTLVYPRQRNLDRISSLFFLFHLLSSDPVIAES